MGITQRVVEGHRCNRGDRLASVNLSSWRYSVPVTGASNVGKYFTDDQVNEFLRIHLERYPDAIQRMHFVMRHPYRNNDERTSQNIREVNSTAKSLEFYHDYARNLPEEYIKRVADPYYYAFFHIHRDVVTRVAAILGPIGTYEIEEFDPSNPLHWVE